MSKHRHAPLARISLTSEEREQVERLADQCNALERLDLKLALDLPPNPSSKIPGAFLIYADDATLAGFCSLEGSLDVEICGMVRPDCRRRGLGTALLAEARRVCIASGARRILLICEDASLSGSAFVARHQGLHRFSELRMIMDQSHLAALSGSTWLAAGNGLVLRLVSVIDLVGAETFARVCAAAFEDDLDEVRRFVAEGLRDGREEHYIAELDGVVAGCLKLIYNSSGAGIYAFGVMPEWRRRGVGKRMLAQAAAIAQARGCTRVWLEVEADNTPALALYRASGFRETTMYGYFEVPLVPATLAARTGGSRSATP